MRKILIATHASFAKGLNESLQFILGEQENVSFMSAYISNEFDIEKEINICLNELSDTDELIVLVDLYGGSVANAFMSQLTDNRVHLITGVNFPMLLDLVLNVDDNLEAVITRAIESAKKGIIYVNKIEEKEDSEEVDL